MAPGQMAWHTICLAACVICFLFHSSFRLLPCGCLVLSGCNSKMSIGSTISLDAYSLIYWLPLSVVCKSMLTRVTHVLTFIRKFRLNMHRHLQGQFMCGLITSYIYSYLSTAQIRRVTNSYVTTCESMNVNTLAPFQHEGAILVANIIRKVTSY